MSISKVAEQQQKADINKLHLSPFEQFAAPFVSVALGLFLLWGWQQRDEYLITAEWGLGYWLGLVAGVFFLLIFIYPARKKFKFMRSTGAIKIWFNLHMFIGVIAPVMIAFHCNFSLGATNSNVALYSMIFVVASGTAGRYIYAQIHYGLFGTQARIEELMDISHEARKMLAQTSGLAPTIENKIKAFEEYVMKPSGGALSFIPRKIFIGVSTWITYFSLRRRLRAIVATQARLSGWDRAQEKKQFKECCKLVGILLKAIRKMAVFTFYEKLFHNWHKIHVVFFSMLLITGLVHVAAVHMY